MGGLLVVVVVVVGGGGGAKGMLPLPPLSNYWGGCPPPPPPPLFLRLRSDMKQMNCSIGFNTDGAQHLTMCMSGFIIPVSRNIVEKCSGTDIMTFL